VLVDLPIGKSQMKKCKRCNSGRFGRRLNSDFYCKRCGQRYKNTGEEIPSHDKRGKYAKQKPERDVG